MSNVLSFSWSLYVSLDVARVAGISTYVLLQTLDLAQAVVTQIQFL
jgi:hypothetical protein